MDMIRSGYIIFYLMLTLDKLDIGNKKVADDVDDIPYFGKTRAENYIIRNF